MRLHRDYHVYFAGHRYITWAASVGHACRQAFRFAIHSGDAKRQPRTDPHTGGWEGVSVECLGVLSPEKYAAT